MTRLKSSSLVILLALLFDFTVAASNASIRGIGRCSDLPAGKYICGKPEIDKVTQNVLNCTRNNTVTIKCKPITGVICDGKVFDGLTTAFTREEFCFYANGYSFEVAISLSVFLGMFGADRFYLGYPALGLLKLSTFGFFMIGQLLDVILIATQVVGPADGSFYQMNYYGPRILPVSPNAATVVKLPDAS